MDSQPKFHTRGANIENEPSRSFSWSYVLSLVVGLSILVAFVATLGHMGVFRSLEKEAALKPQDLDLSGTWKIWFEDKPEFSAAHLNDSTWCLIGVPDRPGEITPASGDRPSVNCPKDLYPRDKMQNHTYWYRKTFTIPEGKKWQKPSLFVGAVKRSAEIFWDGTFIGWADFDDIVSILKLKQEQITPGQHTLAFRVTSEIEAYPGIFHASRSVSLRIR